MIQLAWLWLRYQPGSELAEWFRKRVGTLAGRTRRIAIVALARKLLIALWRYVETGCSSRRCRNPDRDHSGCIEIADGNIADGGTGNATVLIFGGTTPPRFRWVASRRGYASCMRHSGAGSLTGPTVCKVTQP
jgi:hypothetical protein